MPTGLDRIHFPSAEEIQYFASAAKLIGEMANRINDWSYQAPEGQHLEVLMPLPDGRIMLVEEIAPLSFNAFRASGYVEGMKFFVIAHVSTLQVFCAFAEARKGAQPVGFKITTTPLPESAQSAPGTSTDGPLPTE